MGEARERITTSIGKKGERRGSKAHLVNCRPAEDRSGTTGEMGKGSSAAEEGRLERNYNVKDEGPLLVVGLLLSGRRGLHTSPLSGLVSRDATHLLVQTAERRVDRACQATICNGYSQKVLKSGIQPQNLRGGQIERAMTLVMLRSPAPAREPTTWIHAPSQPSM